MEIVSFLAAHHGNRSLLAPSTEAGAQQLVGGVLNLQPIYCSGENGAYLFNKPALSKCCQRSDLMPFTACYTKR